MISALMQTTRGTNGLIIAVDHSLTAGGGLYELFSCVRSGLH